MNIIRVHYYKTNYYYFFKIKTSTWIKTGKFFKWKYKNTIT